jgi:NAD(P)-dependent dehydrogenase (short-subunit alcohol dehydrogenase family)
MVHDKVHKMPGVAMISGANRGIGLEIAREWCRYEHML